MGAHGIGRVPQSVLIWCFLSGSSVWLCTSERVYKPADANSEDSESGWGRDSCVASREMRPRSNLSSASLTFEASMFLADSQLSWLTDGSHIASGVPREIAIWKFDTTHGWQEIQKTEADWLGLSGTGTEVALVGKGDRIHMWDISSSGVSDWKESQIMPNLKADLSYAAVWSPDGQRFAYCGGYAANTTLFRRNGSGLFEASQNLPDYFDMVSWSQDGRQLATSFDDSVTIWSLGDDGKYTKKHAWVVPGQGKCEKLSFSPSGSYLAGRVDNESNTGALHVWHSVEGHWSGDWQSVLSRDRPVDFKWHPGSQRLAVAEDGLLICSWLHPSSCVKFPVS